MHAYGIVRDVLSPPVPNVQHAGDAAAQLNELLCRAVPVPQLVVAPQQANWAVPAVMHVPSKTSVTPSSAASPQFGSYDT